jgi:hypothetical protein
MEVTYDEFLTLANGGTIFRTEGWRKKLKDFVVWAGSKTNYLSKKLLDLPLGATAYSAPATVYAALWTATLDDTSTGSTTGEAAYTSYARVAITNNTTNFPAATGTTTATKSNANAITFPASTGGTSTVTFFAICDASSAGNMLYWCSVTSATVNSGDTPQVAASGFTVTED